MLNQKNQTQMIWMSQLFGLSKKEIPCYIPIGRNMINKILSFVGHETCWVVTRHEYKICDTLIVI